jgi:hypothetical protein
MLFLAPKVYAMDLLIVLSILMGLALAAAAIVLACKLARTDTRLPLTAEWIDELSIERYRPMMHLLDAGDVQFLRSQPGFTPAMAAQLRIERCQVFRGYLRCLRADFQRVCAAVKLLMLHSRYDRPDLAGVLVQQQVMFECGMALVGFRLFLYRFGLCGVDVTDLVKNFDLMRRELKRLVPAAAAMGA